MAKEFLYRGKTIDELKQLSIDEFAHLVPSRERRKIKRGFTEIEKKLIEKLAANKRNTKTHCRDMIILPEMIGKNIKSKVIISYHNFTKTPSYPQLVKIADEIKKRGADVVKIACNASSLSDTVRIISVAKHLESLKIPHILIAMGKKGTLSRILTPTLGGEMMFATLDGKNATASGQLTVKELRDAGRMIGK